MENILKSALVAERESCLPDILNISSRSGLFFWLGQKARKLFISVKEFIECSTFYEGERTNTSDFNTKIELINRLNNRQITTGS